MREYTGAYVELSGLQSANTNGELLSDDIINEITELKLQETFDETHYIYNDILMNGNDATHNVNNAIDNFKSKYKNILKQVEDLMGSTNIEYIYGNLLY